MNRVCQKKPRIGIAHQFCANKGIVQYFYGLLRSVAAAIPHGRRPKIPQKTPNMSSQYTTKQPQEKPIEVKVIHRSNHLWLCCLFIIGISRT